MRSKRLGSAKFRFYIDDVEYTDELSFIELISDLVETGDAEGIPWVTALNYGLELEVIQSLTEGSLWRKLWDNPKLGGQIRWAFMGNETPTRQAPHLVGFGGFLGYPPGIGGQAQVRGSHPFSTQMRFREKPVFDFGEGEEDG